MTEKQPTATIHQHIHQQSSRLKKKKKKKRVVGGGGGGGRGGDGQAEKRKTIGLRALRKTAII